MGIGVTPDADTILLLRLDEAADTDDLVDAAGGDPLVVSGTPNTGTGAVGGSRGFEGFNWFATGEPDAAAATALLGAYCVEVQAIVHNLAEYVTLLAYCGDDSTADEGYRFALYVNPDGGVQVYWGGESGHNTDAGTVVVDTHVRITVRTTVVGPGRTVEVFLNGELIETFTGLDAPTDGADGKWHVGIDGPYPTGGTGDFEASEIVVTDLALTDEQILERYELAAFGAEPFEWHVAATNPVSLQRTYASRVGDYVSIVGGFINDDQGQSGFTHSRIHAVTEELTEGAAPPFTSYNGDFVRIGYSEAIMLGGYWGDDSIPTAEAAIYDAVADAWTSVPNAPLAMLYPRAVALDDGRILVVCLGWEDEETASNVTYVLAADRSGWATLDPTGIPRERPCLVKMADGRVLCQGGTSGGEGGAVCEIFDPETDTWSVTGETFPYGSLAGVGALMQDERVLIVLPDDGSSSAAAYNPDTDDWTIVAAPEGEHERWSVSLNGGAVLATLESGRVALWGTRGVNPELYDPVLDSWQIQPNVLGAERSPGAACYVGGEVVMDAIGDGSFAFGADGEFEDIQFSGSFAGGDDPGGGGGGGGPVSGGMGSECDPLEQLPADGSSGSDTIRDLALDACGDIYIGTDGDIVITYGKSSVLSDISARLKTFLGEWFLDTSLGVPYIERVLVKNPDTVAIRSVIREEIEGTPGVLALTDLQLDYTAASRSLSISFRASTDMGELSGVVEV